MKIALDNDLPTAFCNTDFINIYKKIVGNTSRSDKIQKWIDHHSSLGFRYASQEKITQRMFLYTVTQELGKEPSCSCVPKEFRKYMDEWGIVPINKREDWDIFEDQFHDELLDTDQNRKNLENLYEKYLPGFRIWKFESHRNDYGHFVLRHTVYVPFEAIEDLEKQR